MKELHSFLSNAIVLSFYISETKNLYILFTPICQSFVDFQLYHYIFPFSMVIRNLKANLCCAAYGMI